MAVIATFWFGIGGFIDLFRMSRDLKVRVENRLDNGQVDGHISIAAKAQFEELEYKASESEPKDESKAKNKQ